MNNIAIFASGSGTNAENMVRYFNQSDTIRIKVVLSNNPNAFVLERMGKLNIPAVVFNADQLNGGKVLEWLNSYGIDYIVLAGFLKLIPLNIIRTFPNRIVNIHPALLPKHGGKGMYGMRVHEAVIAEGDTESGITVHLVNERYDEGSIIFQTQCPVLPSDTPQTLADRIHQLEYQHYPRVVQRFIEGRQPDF
ncbi:MAG TPA: phosphoribosylglycinamide formyltransferase [Tenuifilaceae bacterium]|jgi:phosphoribosylglycinamide formyltransferase-1|nr:phosphoribosylglycinamide formyltransferase [Bacteroidales bacterium]MDI9517415.1 phosphoribosylglycinamide formyltransferase [Bacteroidota bacterium]NLH57361.1 phosphoribosylglycinamide formyltransferase [Rikenellaceae bacterium]OQC61434.1 MAG: Phosphoribosylglycinamide formyltransferase [Bacteroidetes bacterium ADurb.Bin008]HNV80248.1 phosphoribosylglycinamide formyltransferase [Tenuifilaceae bacterium]